jgi:putative toxin-antitoxin system antitoxin component (TIGR02293 family)
LRVAKGRAVPDDQGEAPEVRAYLLAVRRSEGHPYVTLLGMRTFDTSSLHDQVRRGLPFQAFQRFSRLTDLSADTLAAILLIPARTLPRRKAQRRLQPDESDRLLRLSRIYGMAIELFEGDSQAAMRWLRAPVVALGGAVPLAMCQTEPGALEVEDLIGRFQHGVFS